MITLWVRGLLVRRLGRLLAVSAGIAVAVALLAALGTFLTSAQSSMTGRALASVPLDWQVEVRPGASAGDVLALVRNTPGTTAAVPVGYGPAAGLSAVTGGSTRTTGAAVVLGLPPGYRALFPRELRTLAGSEDGVLLAQQTAANLGATPGATVTVMLAGRSPTTVRVDGVVDLPAADSLFQNVGAPTGSQPSAPPDNVVLLPERQWHAVFDGPAADSSGSSRTQIHAARSHDLPAAPATAYTAAAGQARNLEARSAGGAVVGDNLGAVLDAARSDAAYATILFLFLGSPGAVLAALLTASVAGAGAARRRAEQALLRARGASGRHLIRLALGEAGCVGLIGAVVGLGVASAVGAVTFGSATFGATASASIGWAAAASGFGLAVAALAIAVPVWRDQRDTTVAAVRSGTAADRSHRSWWARIGLDVVALAAAGVTYWFIARTDYTLVLAPEGVPTISVSYWAFAAPALFWIGVGLLTRRLSDAGLRSGGPLLARALRPALGRMSRFSTAVLARQRTPVARAIVLLTLTVAFVVSTATFNTTYRHQAEVDAKLTNGADVTVTEPPGVTVGPGTATAIAAVPGVRAVEPVQHRFGYVGADLQDVFGVDPVTIRSATALQDTYFQGGTAAELMNHLAQQPDAILVSAETVKDFQLVAGDPLVLRLRDARSGATTPVRFRYAGVVTEFPTAPKDSFFVANAAYLARMTGNDGVGAFLVDTGGTDTTAVATRLRDRLGPAATVTDITTVRTTIGTSLTAVDLAGLTTMELGFGLVLAVAAGGLMLALGLTERRRNLGIVAALGATPTDLRSFVAAETAVLTISGLACGALAGWGLSEMTVSVLSGVFDPPPTSPTAPWPFLSLTFLLATAATIVAAGVVVSLVTRAGTEQIRKL